MQRLFFPGSRLRQSRAVGLRSGVAMRTSSFLKGRVCAPGDGRAFLLVISLLLIDSLAFAPLADAGYEFSISASSSDPHVNTSSPAGGIRNLYLWLVCTDEGLSAFEGDVTGSLTVYGFNPLNGVLNAGGATNLLMAVPGCPVGADVDFLLGYWVVMDTGGTICLGPSAANDIFGAVDCGDPGPTLIEDPEVTGFASDGSSPCSVGENGCVGEGFLLGGSGWGSIRTEYER
jgi:hypothetical protein